MYVSYVCNMNMRKDMWYGDWNAYVKMWKWLHVIVYVDNKSSMCKNDTMMQCVSKAWRNTCVDCWYDMRDV